MGAMPGQEEGTVDATPGQEEAVEDRMPGREEGAEGQRLQQLNYRERHGGPSEAGQGG